MIKVSVFYPSEAGARFDMTYYCSQHMPMVQRLLSPALKGVAVEEGIAGETPGSRPTYVALGHLLFESVEDYQEAFGRQAEAIINDIPNYTNVQPTIQISEVRL